MAAPATVELTGLTHRYAGAAVDALHAVDLSVAAGRRLGLLGPNGAGKSTLMRLLCGYLPVQHGTAKVAGIDVMRDSMAVRRRVGYMPEHVPLYPELRVHEHLRFRGTLKGVTAPGREVERVAERTGLGAVLRTPIGHLSRGYRQRVGIADALLGAPPLLILDEPTVGLDPNQIQDIRALLRDLAGEQTLVFSSHILAEVEVLCDEVAILSEGRLVATETVDAAMRGARVVAAWDAEPAVARALVTSLAEGQAFDATWDGATVTLTPADGDADALRAAVGRASRDAGLVVTSLETSRGRLEERFARLTGGGADA